MHAQDLRWEMAEPGSDEGDRGNSAEWGETQGIVMVGGSRMDKVTKAEKE